MGVISRKYFKSILLFAVLLFLWQPAWGLVKTSDPADPVQGSPDGYFINFSNYVSGETGALSFAIDQEPAWLNFDAAAGTLEMATLNDPPNDAVNTKLIVTVTDQGGSEPPNVTFELTVQNVNDAPIFVTDLSALTLDATEEAAFSNADNPIQVQDIDIPFDTGEGITPSLVNAPDWLTVTGAAPTGDGTVALTLSGTPDEELSLGNPASYSIQIRISDNNGKSAVSSAFTLNVAPVDDELVISGTPNTEVTQDDYYSFQPTIVDPDSTSFTYEITVGGADLATAAPWLTLAADGTLSGTPANADVGSLNNIVITASDATTAKALASFSITVNNKNDNPVIESTAPAPSTNVTQIVLDPPNNVEAGVSYTLDLTVSDIDIDIGAQNAANITYSVSPELPSWLEFYYADGADKRTAQLRSKTNRPDNNDVGLYSDLRIIVTDGEGGVVKSPELTTFNITVDNSNDAPYFTQTPIAIVKVDEDAIFDFIPTGSDVTDTTTKVNKVIAKDIDIKYGDILSYSLDSAAKPSWLSIDSTTGVLTGVPRAEDVGSYPGVTIIVTDSGNGNLTASYMFDVQVSAVNDNPIFKQAPPENQTVTINSGIPFSEYNAILATDEDATDTIPDFVTFKLNTAATWLKITNLGMVDGTTDTFKAELSGTPTNADAGDPVDVQIIAEDNNGGTTTWPFKVQVTYVNIPPEIVTSVSSLAWTEDMYKEYTIEVDDDAEDTLEAMLSTNAPSWLSYKVDGHNVILSGKPQAKDIGAINSITLTVTDGSNEYDTMSFSINVQGINDAPVITGSLPVAIVGQAFNFTPVATDEEGDEITFGVSPNPLPDWLTFDALTGALTGKPAQDDIDETSITITAYDSNGGSDALTATLKVIADGTVLRGDVDASTAVELADAIIVLQILADISPSASITLKADADMNGNLGLEDVIYIMNNLSAPVDAGGK